MRSYFESSTSGRTTLTLMALDANFPIAVLVGYGLLLQGDPTAVLRVAPWLLLTVPTFPVVFAATELYSLRGVCTSGQGLLRCVGVTVGVVLLFGGAYHFVADSQDAWSLSVVLGAGMVVEVLAARALTFRRALRGQPVRSALVLGAGWGGRTVIDCALREPRLRIKVVGAIDDDPLKRNVQYKGVAVIGTGQGLLEAAERTGASLVVVAISQAQNAELIKNLLALRRRGVEVLDMPEFCEKATGQIAVRHDGDAWFLYSGGFEQLLHRPHRLVGKRTVDLVGSALALALALPLLGLVALLVRLESRGRVLVRQERIGRGERPFFLLKFRTLRAGCSAAAPLWESARDCRVTRVGRWLRMTGLDEIPQLLNVLKGDMSFVGPRAERSSLAESLKREIPYHAMRYAVRPGATGWAQVQYHTSAPVEDALEKLKYDLYYVKNASCRLDVWIALKSLKEVFFGRAT